MGPRAVLGRQHAVEVEEEEEVENRVEEHHAYARAEGVLALIQVGGGDADLRVLVVGEDVGAECKGGGQQQPVRGRDREG